MLSISAVPIPAQFDQIIQSSDMAYKDLATSGYVVGQVWGAFKANRYLLDHMRSRWDTGHESGIADVVIDTPPEAPDLARGNSDAGGCRMPIPAH